MIDHPDDLAPRLDAQTAMMMSMSGGAVGVRVGASHGIGHVLGGYAGVSHGHTSCVLLPAVMQWNRPANGDRQFLVSMALGHPGEEASIAIGSLVGRLGLPRRLREVGVQRDQFPLIAEKVMEDFSTSGNPRPITRPADVGEILELAW